MRGTMLWFNEEKREGIITAETGERLRVEEAAFERGAPEGRCGGAVVTVQLSDDRERAEQHVLVPDVNSRRAPRRSSGHR
jgi:cold shock CspA family protein